MRSYVARFSRVVMVALVGMSLVLACPESACAADEKGGGGRKATKAGRVKARTRAWFKTRPGVVIVKPGAKKGSIDAYSVQERYDNETTTVYPAVKYRLIERSGRADDVLEIHLYVRFWAYTAARKWGGLSASSKRARTYRKAVAQYYAKVMAGSGRRYKTKVIWHYHQNRQRDRMPAEQAFFNIEFGGGCRAARGCPAYRWYHAHPTGPLNGGRLVIPTAAQVRAGGEAARRGQGYRSMLAHETAHLLGLDDAYKPAGKKKPDRMIENRETCAKRGRRYVNLMKDDQQARRLLPNDVEMMLRSLQASLVGDEFLQSYRCYRLNGQKFYHSKAIGNVKDKVGTKKGVTCK
jgi:hypothetical protein